MGPSGCGRMNVMVSEESPGLVVTVGNSSSPHMRGWISEAKRLGWKRIHVESHGSGLLGASRLVGDVIAAKVAALRYRSLGRRVVEAHGAGRAGLVACVLVARHPTVIVHGSEVITRGASVGKRSGVAWVLRRAGEIIVTAPATIPFVLELAPRARQKIRVVHPGVDWTRFSVAHVDRSDAVRMLSIRRMLPLYQIVDLVEGFQRTGGAVDELALLQGDISADASYARKVEEQVERAATGIGIIDKFLSADELRDLYARVDIAVSLAETDQLSSSILEALAAGCIVILSDLDAYESLTGLPQVITVPVPSDPGVVADAIDHAAQIVHELGRSTADRAARAESARCAFMAAFGADSTLLR